MHLHSEKFFILCASFKVNDRVRDPRNFIFLNQKMCKNKHMKKLLFVILLPLLLVSCNKTPASVEHEKLPGANYYYVKLTKNNCGLSVNESTEIVNTILSATDEEGNESEYQLTFNINPPCYQHSKYDEIVLKSGSFIECNSSYRISYIAIDYFSLKGIKFTVSDSSKEIKGNKSKIAPQDVDDGGAVLDYDIKGNYFKIAHSASEFEKPALYSVLVVLEI